FGIRKRLLEYDDVMNIQREAIYKKRNNALFGERLSVDLNNMFDGMITVLVEAYQPNNDFAGFRRNSLSILGLDPKIDEIEFKEGAIDDIINKLLSQFTEFYNRKAAAISELLLPRIKEIHENESHFKRILIPFTDGRAKPLQITADIAKAAESNGVSIMRDIEKTVTLAIIDEKWKEHLRGMDELKESTQAASFEQKDPLVVYKMEAYELFEQLITEINESVTSYLAKGTLIFSDGSTLEQAREQRMDLSKTRTNKSVEEEARKRAAARAGREERKVETYKRKEKKIGRNDPCPCGSGKKYKQCHGRS
ncbi:MAG: SEC-C metal-binding domain-containing protein, partial [Bacteroidota bacterium]